MGTPVFSSPDGRYQIDGPSHHLNALAGDEVMRVLSVYLKAARGDGPTAQRLGNFYLAGDNVPTSAPKAWAWFKVAAQNDLAAAREKISTAESQMSGEELKSAQKELEKISADMKPVAVILRRNP